MRLETVAGCLVARPGLGGVHGPSAHRISSSVAARGRKEENSLGCGLVG
jgi:hypothetical protein